MNDDEEQQLHQAVRRALAALSRSDPEAAELAEHAWRWVFGPLAPEDARRHELQTFLWYGLPRKWLTDVEEHLATARALGDLCALLGLEPHAAVCRAEETAAVLRAYDRDDAEGFSAFQRALERSGLDPPDVPELAWGGLMSMDEARARAHVADALEAAVDDGRLRPGSRGWRGEQQRVAARALQDDVPGQPVGETWLQAVITARLGDWMHGNSDNPLRQRLLRELEPVLLHPVAPPPEAEEIVAPLRWLLERADGEGLPLTERGNLARAVVREAVATFGWHDETFGKQVHSEIDLQTLPRWHDLVREQRWVRRRGRLLVATAAGRALLDDMETSWRGLCAALGAPSGFDGAVREAVLLLLLAAGDDLIAYEELMEGVAAVVTEEGWRSQDQRPPTGDDIRYTAGPFLGTLQRFGLVESRWHRDGPNGERLLGPGRPTAVEALRHRATAPRP